MVKEKTYLGTLIADQNGLFSGTINVSGKGFVAGTSYITNTATEMAATGSTSEFGVNVTPLNISGTVAGDTNGMSDNTVNGTGTNAGGTLYVALYDNTVGQVVDVVPVNADGTYSFTGAISSSNYSIYLTSTLPTIGQTAPMVSLPSGWSHTGEVNCATPGCTGSDGSADGILSLGMLDAGVALATFGIKQACPTTLTLAITNASCGHLGAVTVTVPSGSDYTFSKDGGTYQNSPYFPGLATGNYTFYAQSIAGGCLLSSPVTIDTDPCSSLYCNSDLVWNDSDGNIGTYDVTTNSKTTLCNSSTILGDIAIDQYGQMWGLGFPGGILYRINPSNCTFTNIADVGFADANSISVLPDGSFLIGGFTSSTVKRYNPATNVFTDWHTFSGGGPNGDYIFLNGAVYILWYDGAVDVNYPHIYKAEVDGSFNFTSYTDLGPVQRFSYGLAKVNGELYAPTSVGIDGTAPPNGTIIKIPLPNVSDWTVVFADPIIAFNGATSYQESQFIDAPLFASNILYTSCQGNFANLNDLAATTSAPNGTELVWFTNPDHTGTALTASEITNAGVGTYYAFYRVTDSNCYSPGSEAITIQAGICISGNVFNDANGNATPDAGESPVSGDNTTNGGTSVVTGGNLYVNLVDENNAVVQSVQVNADGSFDFAGIAPGDSYKIVLTTAGQLTGTTLATGSGPAGWSPTGTTVNGVPSTGNDTYVIDLGTVTASTDAGFGIDRVPVSDDISHTLTSQPASGSNLSLNGIGGPLMAGSDPEDGTYSGSTGSTTNPSGVVITSLPTNGELWYYGFGAPVRVSATDVANGQLFPDPSLFGLVLTGAGYTSTTFEYAYVDAAGAVSSEPASYTVSWESPLPVKLISFNAYQEGQSAHLMWSTASEENSKGFEIECSADATAWTTIGFVASLDGNSNSQRNYEFPDNSPLKGLTYYRLKMVDLDATFAYSQIRVLRTGSTNQVLATYPNPVVNGTLNIDLSGDESYTAEVTSLSGNRVLQQNLGKTRVLHLGNLASGTYLLRMRSAGGSETTAMFVVVK